MVNKNKQSSIKKCIKTTRTKTIAQVEVESKDELEKDTELDNYYTGRKIPVSTKNVSMGCPMVLNYAEDCDNGDNWPQKIDHIENLLLNKLNTRLGCFYVTAILS